VLNYLVTVSYSFLFVFISYLLVKMNEPLDIPLDKIINVRHSTDNLMDADTARQIYDEIHLQFSF